MIAHIDIDAFFAAVELHRHPELRGRPVVVGGDPDGRGVVATASYAARAYGVRSAMSAAEARRRCPDAVFLRPNMNTYRAWSVRLWSVVADRCRAIEQAGLDEAYVVLDDSDPVDHARAIQRAVRDTMRLSCSVGVAAAKVVAKVASDVDKPGGLTVVPPGEEAAFLAPMPLRALPGVGPRTEQRLGAAGLTTIGDLAALDPESDLISGVWGRLINQRARGVDPRPVDATPTERVSVSTERTFPRDLTRREDISTQASAMAARVADTLKARERYARTVTIKLRYGDFSTVTRAHTLTASTDDAEVIEGAAERLIDAALALRSSPIRLLGVGATGLSGERQLALFRLDPS